jgi:hypothetical protein
MRLKTREAIVGLLVYRAARRLIRRSIGKKLGQRGGGIMAGTKKVGLVAMIGAALGALLFWRKKKRGSEMGGG